MEVQSETSGKIQQHQRIPFIIREYYHVTSAYISFDFMDQGVGITVTMVNLT